MCKKPDSKLFNKKNHIRPFEDATSLEFLARTNDTSLFLYGSHSKKRPHNLVMGRMFDFQVRDMIELGVDPKSFRSMAQLGGSRSGTARIGGKPMFVFRGDGFEQVDDLIELKSLVLDYFRGDEVEAINLAALDRVFVVTESAGKVFFRHYAVLLKKSGSKFPRVELEEVGPRMDLTVRRRHEASEAVRKASLKRPRSGTVTRKKKKNVETSRFSDVMGRVHMERQDFDDLELKKMRAHKRRRQEEVGGGGEGAASSSSSSSSAGK